jgi:hypothetical protein
MGHTVLDFQELMKLNRWIMPQRTRSTATLTGVPSQLHIAVTQKNNVQNAARYLMFAVQQRYATGSIRGVCFF